MMRIIGYILTALYLAWLLPFAYLFFFYLPINYSHYLFDIKSMHDAIKAGTMFTWLAIFLGINWIIICVLDKLTGDDND